MDKLIIPHPRAHRDAWIAANPQALVEGGGLLSREDLARWACDLCMAPLNPDVPIPVLDGLSMCPKCARKHDIRPWPHCRCVGCETAG